MELLIAALSARPDPNGLPGSGSRLSTPLLLGPARLLGAMIVGWAMWWAGAHSHNAYAAGRGKVMLIGAFVGAILCGAAPALINFAEGLGSKVQATAARSLTFMV